VRTFRARQFVAGAVEQAKAGEPGVPGAQAASVLASTSTAPVPSRLARQASSGGAPAAALSKNTGTLNSITVRTPTKPGGGGCGSSRMRSR